MVKTFELMLCDSMLSHAPEGEKIGIMPAYKTSFSVTAKLIRFFLLSPLRSGNGHTCYLQLANGNSRMIIHGVLDEPLSRLPWPLYLIQLRLGWSVTVVELEKGKQIYRKTYKYRNLNTAINDYLNEVVEDSLIQFQE